MATPWSQVVQSPAYQALGPGDREAARQQYWQQVVAPQLSDDATRTLAKQQFDAQTGPQSTPFGKGVEAAAAAAHAEDAQPPSLASQAGRAFLRTARALPEGLASIPDIVLGPLKYVTGGRTGTAQDALNTVYNATGVPNLPAQTTAERYADAITRGVGGAAGGVGVGNILAGSAAPMAATIGRTLAANPGAQLAATTTGAGSAQTAQEMGAGLGGQLAAGLVGGLVPGGVASAGRLAGNLLPLTAGARQGMVANYLNHVAGGEPITLTPSAVPGVAPTLAESSANPGLAQLQRALQNQPENVTNFSRLESANNAARQNYLTGQFGTPDTIAELTAQRAAETRPLYNLAANMDAENSAIRAGTADNLRNQGRLLPGGAGAANNAADAVASAVPDQIKPLMGRPAFQQAVKDAQNLLAERGRQDVNPLTSVEGLQAIKTSLDNAINKAPTNSAATFDLNAARNTRSLLVKAMQDISPVQREADTKFAELSKPITAQEVGQELINRGTGNLTDPNTGLPSLQPNAYAGALERGDQIAQRVTGQKNATLAGSVSPEQMNALNAVRGDLDRVAFAANAGRAKGSPTGQNILSQNALQNIASAVGIPGLANSGAAQMLLRPLDKIYSLFGLPETLKGDLTRVMLDPTSADAAAVWAKIPTGQREQIARGAAPYLYAIRQAASQPQPATPQR